MKKQCEVLVRVGKKRFIPIGTAELDIRLMYNRLSCDYKETMAKLNRLDVNVKKGDTIWEKKPNIRDD